MGPKIHFRVSSARGRFRIQFEHILFWRSIAEPNRGRAGIYVCDTLPCGELAFSPALV